MVKIVQHSIKGPDYIYNPIQKAINSIKKFINQFKKYSPITFWLWIILLITTILTYAYHPIYITHTLQLTIFLTSFLAFLPAIKKYSNVQCTRVASSIMIIILWVYSSWNTSKDVIFKKTYNSFTELIIYIIIALIIVLTSMGHTDKDTLNKKRKNLKRDIKSLHKYIHSRQECKKENINFDEITDNMWYRSKPTNFIEKDMSSYIKINIKINYLKSIH